MKRSRMLRLLERRRASIDRAISYLKAHPGGWADDPADFFPAADGKT